MSLVAVPLARGESWHPEVFKMKREERRGVSFSEEVRTPQCGMTWSCFLDVLPHQRRRKEKG